MSSSVEQAHSLEEETTPRSVKPKPKSWRRFLTRRLIALFVLGLIVLGGLVAGGVFYYTRYSKTEAFQKKQADKELVNIVRTVGSILLLPAGKPTLLTVADPEALAAQQPFFRGSIAGDKLLIYKDAGKAILYSPARHLIVNVGPITADGAAKTPATGEQTEAPAKTEAPVVKKK